MGPDGDYVKKPLIEGLKDFVSQLFSNPIAPAFSSTYAPPSSSLSSSPMAGEMPYTLLRRGENGYQVRSYLGYVAAQVSSYSKRSEAWEKLENYAVQLNKRPFAPSIMEVQRRGEGEGRGGGGGDTAIVASSLTKKMHWPLQLLSTSDPLPQDAGGDDGQVASSSSSSSPAAAVGLVEIPPTVYAVKTFSEPLTEDTVEAMHYELMAQLKKEGLRPKEDDESALGKRIFVQFDELYSLGDRRNEVWIPLEDHLWPDE